MAMLDQRDDEEVISTINIIPFVDIVLVLLIIFMVTSTAIVKAAIKVDLPKAASAGSAVETTVNLVVAKDGELILDGQTVDENEAARRIRALSSKNPKIQAVISADKLVAYGRVIAIIDLVKQNGVETFALNIERELALKQERL